MNKRLPLLSLLVACRLFAAGEPAKPTAFPVAGLSDAEAERVIYLEARLARSRDAERMAREFLANHPGNRSVMLTLCSMFAEQRRVEDLFRATHAYLKLYPDDPQGVYYLASAEYQSGHYTEAVKTLRRIRRLMPKGAQNPYLVDMASNAWLDGDWTVSLEAHLELLRNERLSPELRMQMRRQLDELYRKHLDVAQADIEYVFLNTGDVLRPMVSDEVQASLRTRAGALYRGDSVHLDGDDGLRRGSYYRQEAFLYAEYTHDTLWTSSGGAGLSQSGPLAKYRLEYARPQKRGYWFEASYNGRATDSLALEALDGRESKFSLGGSQFLSDTLELSGSAYARHLAVDGETLGDGGGANWRLAKTIFQNGPSLVVAYRGMYDGVGFSGDSVDMTPVLAPVFPSVATEQTLVARRFHRHGVEAEWAGHYGSAWLYRYFVSADYDVEAADGVYGGGAEFTFRPRKSVEFSARAEYSSSATAGNAGSEALLLGLSARILY